MKYRQSSRGSGSKDVGKPQISSFFWVYGTLVVAWILNLLPWSNWPVTPDFLVMTLVFWGIYQPQRVGVAVAFFFGLMMDSYLGATLGQNALVYSAVSFGAIAMRNRLVWLSLPAQALNILPLFLLPLVIVLFVRLWTGEAFPGWIWFSKGIAETVFWPLWSLLLLKGKSPGTDRRTT